jgi:pimeloyl-ACP methyl ester carboxylesterase
MNNTTLPQYKSPYFRIDKPHTPKIHFGLYLLALLVGLTACSRSAQKPSILLGPCKVASIQAQCGRLEVYEDRASRSGRTINLNVAVIKAQSEHPKPDPIFWISGGPGGAATDPGWIFYEMSLLGAANQQRDVVLVDQRGTGLSNRLVCPQPTDPARQVETLRSCLADMDGDPSAYTTAWAMDDLDDVRTALGYDRINLYGGSYGATAIQVYLLRHGSHVRTATLDGVSLLEVPMFERYPISSQAALEKMFVRCEADTACHAAFPNLRQEFSAVLGRLAQGPITLPINDPLTGQPVVLTVAMFKKIVHGGLASTPTVVVIPQFIDLVYREDWDGLAEFSAPFMSSDPEAANWVMMNLTILCFEDWAKIRPAEIEAVSAGSYLNYADVRALTVPDEICSAMPRPRAEALYGPLKSSSVPVLLFSGEVDPQDPPENVAGAKQRYPNSLSLVAPGQAHGFTGIPCRADILTDFIDRGSVEGLSTECLDEVPLPAFVIP